jgi:DNA processing protein
VKPRALTDAQRLAWLRLARSESVGAVTFIELIRHFGDAGDALDALPEMAGRAGRSSVRICSVAEAERELEAGAALGARLMASCEPDFPELLARTDDTPPLIWARGRTELFEATSVAIVGARITSAAGQRFARELAAGVGEAGCVVASGMARGIDAAAHEGSLESGSVAVLAGGVDDIYPAENRRLYERLIEIGCVISERPPGQKAKAQDFIRRNRIISGLSAATVVVEAEMRSGSLTTARMAGEQGREVLAVPGSPLDPRAKGTNDLIRNGAWLCEGPEDVLRVLTALPHVREPRGETWSPATPASLDDAEGLRDVVAGLLSPTPVSRDEIVRACGGPAPAVFAALMELSLAGRAELLPGGLVCAA